jgi:DNA transposition AAA+ family ATPase
MKKHKIINLALRDQLDAYRIANNLSIAALGKELGYSSATVSTYLGNVFDGDVDKFESRVQDVLRTAPLRKLVSIDTFETAVTKLVEGSIRTIQETNQFALIHGPAGIGKSVGAKRFVASNPTTILITLLQACCNAHYIAKEIFSAIKTRNFASSGMNRTEFIVSALKGSHRVIIVDNAQRITASARRWLFDIYDATGCPIVLIGNPEVLDPIKLNDQHFSRIGLATGVRLKVEEIPDIARRVLAQMCPENVDELAPYAIEVATKRGHLRCLRNEIELAKHFMSKGKSAKDAFRLAHTKLVRDYDLAD